MEWDKNEIFVRKLRYYMAEKHLSQSDLADKIGVNKSTISKYLKGTSVPKMYIVEKIASLFNVTVQELVNDDVVNKEGIDYLIESNEDFKALIEIASNSSNETLKLAKAFIETLEKGKGD